MSSSTLFSVLIIVIPFLVGLSVYGVLRRRDMRATTAGCLCIVAGMLVSFLLTGILFLAR